MGCGTFSLIVLLGVSLVLAEGLDKCGCPAGEGWSMANKRCQKGSVTDHWDDCVDRCGCKYPQGWSTASQQCKTGNQSTEKGNFRLASAK